MLGISSESRTCATVMAEFEDNVVDRGKVGHVPRSLACGRNLNLRAPVGDMRARMNKCPSWSVSGQACASCDC